MTDESNICEQCGGSKIVRWAIEGFTDEEARKRGYNVPFTFTVEPPFTAQLRICTCPVLREKHDGNLDTYSDSHHASVEIDASWWDGLKRVEVFGGYGGCDSESIYLDPQQALSLLKWLQQERPALEKLVEEGKG